MKRNAVVVLIISVALSFLTFSCGSLGAFGDLLQTPSLSMEGISINSLDTEGITFNCDYSIKNPYGVSLSLAGLKADISYDNSKVTTVSSNSGVVAKAQSSTKNRFNFKVPYTSIINLARSTSGKKTLPFAVDGTVTLDISKVPALSYLGDTLDLPVAADFDVPVFKPKMSVSNVAVKMPTLTDLKNQLIDGGLGVIKAAQVATTLLSGNKITADILDGIDMDIDFTFDVNVANEGNADWEFNIKDCSLKTAGGALAKVSPSGKATGITSKSATVPMTVSLNTIQSGAFIVQLLNKSGSNPIFMLDTGLSFPDTKYAKNIPLSYSYEIPLSSVKKQ
ncbi:MAG: LEA type 2 family protein [Treponema sp.]|nr:LEA type 2 family protein [Treponema sp.]MBP5753974.1 LEA type 2 family protein [Treponema sp.]